MRYRPGERVALAYTDDPHTALRPGDAGTVVRHDEATGTVDIDWDSGSRLSMCLDAGDRIHRLSTPDSRAKAADAGTAADPAAGSAPPGPDRRSPNHAQP